MSLSQYLAWKPKTENEVYTSLYWFTKYICDYDLLVKEPHARWCYTLQKGEHKKYMFLKPRNTYKSTIYSIAFPLWMLLKDPTLRILIITSGDKLAWSIGRAIKDQIKENKKDKS